MIVALAITSAAFLASRIAFLDADLPGWWMSQLQPIDELYYTIPAFNLYHYGSMAHRVVSFVPTDGAPLNLLQNLLTWPMLVVFGNNYYGLRMGSVVAGLGSMLFLYFCLRRHTQVHGDAPSDWLTDALPALWMAYLVCDFAFVAATRVAEPTIFEVLALTAILFVASAWPVTESNAATRAAVLGFMAVAAWLFVYVYNAFIVPAVLLAILIEASRGGLREVVLRAAAAIAGAIGAIALYAVVVYLAYGQSLLDLYHDTVQPLSGRVQSSGLEPWYVIFTTNLFRFDLPLLVAFALAVPVFAYRVYRERDMYGVLAGSLLIFLMLQTGFAPTYWYRKLLIAGPLVILVVSMAIPYAGRFAAAIRIRRQAAATTLAYLALVVAGITFLYLRVQYDWDPMFKRVTQACIVLLVLCVAGAVVAGEKHRPRLIAASFAAVIIPGLFMSFANVYRHPAFRYRDAMVAAAPQLDGRVTVGEVSFAMRLYNTSEPVVNIYQYVYRPAGRERYNALLDRIVSSGAASYSVSSAGGFPPVTGVTAEEVATYSVQAPFSPALSIYHLTAK